MLEERVLAPLIGAALVVSVVTIAWSMKSHANPRPLLLTLVAVALVAAGRLVWSLPLLLYGGSVALLAASLWNLWLKRRKPAPLVRVRPGGRA